MAVYLTFSDLSLLIAAGFLVFVVAWGFRLLRSLF